MTIDGSSRNQNTVEDQESVPDEGLPERFEQLFRNQNKALVHMLSERLRDPEAARDVAQEAYERIFKGDRAGTLTNLRVATLAYLRNYLFKTAHNIALDRLRARAVRARDAVSVAQHLDGGDAPSAEHVCIQAQEWERFKEPRRSYRRGVVRRSLWWNSSVCLFR